MTPGIERITRAAFLGIVGSILSMAPACAADAKAEIDFVTRASVGNLAATAESQLALDRAGDPQLEAYARQLIDEHGSAETALEAAAEGSGAMVPSTLDPDHKGRLTALQSKAGTDFDKAYVADQVEVHSNALTLYADYMLLGDHPKLKALAIRMIPITEAQFKRAQALANRGQ